MDFLISILPEIITVLVAVGIAVARTTDNSLDDKVANLAQDNQKSIRKAIEGLIAQDKVKEAAKAQRAAESGDSANGSEQS